MACRGRNLNILNLETPPDYRPIRRRRRPRAQRPPAIVHDSDDDLPLGEATARKQARRQARNQARNQAPHSPVEAPNEAPNEAPIEAPNEAPTEAPIEASIEAPIDADDDIPPILEGNDIWTPQLQEKIEQIDALADALAPNTASSEHVSSPKVAWEMPTPPAAVPMSPSRCLV